MFLSYLKLINFRNYKYLEVNFNNGINYILGENAKGKTNLVEAIYFLSIARSFKTNNIKELFKKNSDDFFVKGIFNSNSDSNNELEIYANSKGKRITLNNKKIAKTSELSRYISALVFTPNDTFLLKDSPKDRRYFMNLNISKLYKNYPYYLNNYEKLLKERNSILKEENIDYSLLNVVTNELIDTSKEIYSYRNKFFEQINDKINSIYKELDENNNKISVKYESFISDLDNYKNLANKIYKDSLKEDILKKVTTKGIHKEDFSIYLNEKDIGIYGSQGENRLINLSLILTPYFINNEFNIKPIVILDDVLSELDMHHESKLINFLNNLEQVFITGTKENNLLKNNVYYVDNDDVYRR